MIGSQIGSYQIIEEIGRGGMATVYRAHQPAMERDVAIKIIQGGLSDNRDSFERFQREARLIARLEHPHILPVYDFDGAHDPPYIVMRYFDSGTLKEVLQKGILTFAGTAYLLRQLAGALDYAHRQGIVHRDIKPSNIMIDHEGNAFITDFGIARITAGSTSHITETGIMLGTPDYIAPEQALGKDTVDHRADIYSLGVMFFQMITGNLPYQAASSMSVTVKHINAEIPSATNLNPDLPPEIDKVIVRVMAKSPDDRYETATDFANAVIKALGSVADMPITLRLMTEQVQDAKSDTDSQNTPREQQKQLTVLYANAGEFMEIADMEADDPQMVRQNLWEQIDNIIIQHGGYIDNHTGDTVLALWGVVSASEDNTEQAIRAALAMQATIQTLGGEIWDDAEDELVPMQIGIHTGVALLTRQEDDERYYATGPTVNMASRLERSAPAGGILISQQSYSDTRGIFLVEGLSPVRLRGSKNPVQVYLVKGAKDRAFYSDLQGGVEGVETRTIGREAELKQLGEAMEIAMEDHETQAVTIVGEAGVGKSRLIYELIEWEEKLPSDFWFFPSYPTPQMVNQPYALLRELFAFRFEIQDSDSTDIVQGKFERGIQHFLGSDTAEVAHIIAHLVGFTFPDSPYLQNRDPQQLNALGQKYIIQFFVDASRLISSSSGNPMTGAWIQLENIHWADDRSLDLMNQLLEDHSDLALVMTCTARPSLYERRPTWGSGQDFHTRIDLRPLSKRDSRKLVREILKKTESIPAELRDLIIERSEGNPFYMEELVKMLVEDKVILTSDDKWVVESDRLAQARIPVTLTGLLQARLDSLLPDERITLQRAAVVGRIFWDDALQALQAADNIPVDVARALDVLTRRELIQIREETTFDGVQEYIFKSTMLRDVTYESILRRQQRNYHFEVANWLVHHSESRTEYHALIAEHYEIAGEDVQAAAYFFFAGEQAQRVSAYAEAVAFYERGLELVKGQVDDDARRLQITLNNHLGRIDEELGRYSEAETYLVENLAVARDLGDQKLVTDTINILGTVAFKQGKSDESIIYLEEALALAREIGDVTGQVHALMWLSVNLYFHQADYVTAEMYLVNALELAQQIDEQALLARIWNARGENSRHQARFDEASVYYQNALHVYEAIGNSFGIMLVKTNLGHVRAASGDTNGAMKLFCEVLRIGLETGSVYTNSVQETLVGLAGLVARNGEYERALNLLGMVLSYPDTGVEARFIADPILAQLNNELSPDNIAEGFEHGKSLDWEATVTELTAEYQN